MAKRSGSARKFLCPMCGSYEVELTHQKSIDRSGLKEISLKCMMYECREEGHFIATSAPEAHKIWVKRVGEGNDTK